MDYQKLFYPNEKWLWKFGWINFALADRKILSPKGNHHARGFLFVCVFVSNFRKEKTIISRVHVQAQASVCRIAFYFSYLLLLLILGNQIYIRKFYIFEKLHN
ncbi:hypothetical protein BpHYR1_034748 [Brachionus plicatilis]|uniref:Uncharacterized protein n=1 Tax=Brachionus plicatilis TaxID=10195 RepID=A0A3M7RS54_BRAPC|nr:hypothetical protein BpHYR1_034748 [Brachionus plicatilis]